MKNEQTTTKKVLNPYSRKNPTPGAVGQKFTMKSQTIPMLSVTVRDILMRTANGEIVPNFPKTYDQDEEMKHTVKMYVTDLTEIDKVKREVQRLTKEEQRLQKLYEQEQEQQRLSTQKNVTTTSNDDAKQQP